MKQRRFGWMVAVALGLICTTGKAWARSGKAAYHSHTSALVTAARYEPRGSVLKVVNPENGNSVVVVVNDRGPFNGNRILDLSTGAFRQLYGGLGRGVGPVSYTVLSRGASAPSYVLSSRSGSRRRGRAKYNRHRRYRRHSSRRHRNRSHRRVARHR